jgi:GNAT superfamily N-acetyltransferase
MHASLRGRRLDAEQGTSLRAEAAANPVSIEEFGLGDPRIREFEELPWRLYRGDPCWTPPLRADYLGSKTLGNIGLLTPAHPYHRYAEVTHFLARRGKRAVGRISAAINHRFNEYYGVGTKLGFFGFFEVEEDFDAAVALLDAARAWISARGMLAMRGPGEYSNATHERQGILVDGFEHPPTVELTHNPPYYGQFLERWGLEKVKDYHAYMIALDDCRQPDLIKLAARVEQEGHVTTRTARMEDLHADIRLVIEIYNEAWCANWGFLPVTPEEADAVADTLKPIIDPELVRFAFYDGEPAAVIGGFPDPNWALKPRWKWYGDSDAVRIARLLRMRRHIPRVRLMFFGIRPAFRRHGIDALLYEKTLEYALAKGYHWVEPSMLLEDNDLILSAARFMGGHRYKTWRVYERAL